MKSRARHPDGRERSVPEAGPTRKPHRP